MQVGNIGFPSSPGKQEINVPGERYPPCTRRMEGIFITRNREFNAEKVVYTNINISSLTYYPKPLCLVNSL